MAPRIVIIEDEPDIVELVRYSCQKEGFELESFGRGKDGFEHLRRKGADLVLLDIMLPDLDGLEICRRLRADENLKAVPVIFLTAKGAEIDRVLGLELGADDYVVKPFSPRELIARVRAVLRRKENLPQTTDIIDIGELHLDCQRQQATVRGKAVELSTLEFKLLRFLAAHPGRIHSRDKLLDQVWGQDRFVAPRTVDVHIRRLREKIEEQPDEPRSLLTVRGAGYRFADPTESRADEAAGHPAR
jgi:phosphate regulon transcriptional regulator PhoB